MIGQPGPAATSFDTNTADLSPYFDGPYAGMVRALDKAIREQTPNGTTPEDVAASSCAP